MALHFTSFFLFPFQSFLYPVSPNIIISVSSEALLSLPSKQSSQQEGAPAHLRSDHGLEFGSCGNRISFKCRSLPRRLTACLIYCGRGLSPALREMLSSSSWLSILIRPRKTQRQAGVYLKLLVTGLSGSLLSS